MTTRARLRAWIARVVVFASVVTLLVALPATVSTESAAQAADASRFNAGNIIDDATFYDSNALDANGVQNFLNGKVSRCSSGYTCLKDYRQNTDNRPADRYCNGYTGRGNESAAQIIDNVARSCGISQKVILVLLEKEQSLVTHTAPSSTRYAAATGQGCPDTAPCNTATLGFFYQVYYAARQYEIYRLHPTSWGYQAGRWNNIYYDTDPGCGTARIYIENQATAGLYIYTPYTPNAAALRNLYGEGDGCSSYGNRNFWRLFTDWFGSTQGGSGAAAISVAYERYGGPGGRLGAALGNVSCGLAQGGCWQGFANGEIHWTAATGAVATYGAISSSWRSEGSETGPLGYPRTEELCVLVNNGCYQEFQNGQMHWSSASGAQRTMGEILKEWQSLSSERGPLGYPLERQQCVLADGGCYQLFQGGQVHYSPGSGAHATRDPALSYWQGRGSERSVLRYPTSDQNCGLKDGGCFQQFQGGLVHWTAQTGVRATVGDTLQAWARTDWERGPLGYPVTDDGCGLAQGGCRQDFQGGRIYWLPFTSAQSVYGPILQKWIETGAEAGPLGYPRSSTNCVLAGGGCYQEFQNGQIHYSPSTGAHATSGATLSRWLSLGSEKSPWGYPVGAQQCVLANNGCYQEFQGGQIHFSPSSGAHASRGDILQKWQQLGSERSSLGYPLSEQTCGLRDGGCYQDFQGGLIHWTAATGAHATQGGILQRWAASGYEHGTYGYPIADAVCTASGCSQAFQGGTIR